MKSLLTSLLLVLTIVSATAQTSDQVASTPALNYDWRPGFVTITELTYAPGIKLTDVPFSRYYYGITTVAGYQFTRNIKAGVGLGIHLHNEGTLVPLYIDVRYSFNAQEFVPFFAAAGGLALNLTELSGESRIFIYPSFGMKWVTANRAGISFSTGIMTMSGGGFRDSFVSFKLGVELKGKN